MSRVCVNLKFLSHLNKHTEKDCDVTIFFPLPILRFGRFLGQLKGPPYTSPPRHEPMKWRTPSEYPSFYNLRFFIILWLFPGIWHSVSHFDTGRCVVCQRLVKFFIPKSPLDKFTSLRILSSIYPVLNHLHRPVTSEYHSSASTTWVHRVRIDFTVD